MNTMHTQTRRTRPRSLPGRQQGIALMMGMLILVILAVVGINTMNESVLQERMTGGLRNAELAINGAESGLREGERFLWDWFTVSNGVRLVGDDVGTQGVYSSEVDNTFVQGFRDATTWNTDGTEYGNYDMTGVSYGSLAANPRYMIEEIGEDGFGGGNRNIAEWGAGYNESGSLGLLRYYRVTSRSPGGTSKVVRVVESTFTLSE